MHKYELENTSHLSRMRTLEAIVAQTLGEGSSSDQDVWWVIHPFFALVLVEQFVVGVHPLFCSSSYLCCC